MAQIPQLRNDQRNQQRQQRRISQAEQRRASQARINAQAESMAAEWMASNKVAKMIQQARWEAFTLGINQGRIEGMSYGYNLGFNQGRRNQG